MILLVDTNVLLSAVIRDRLPQRVIEAIAARDDWFWIVTSEIEAEYREVLSRPKFKITEPDQREWFEFLASTVYRFSVSAPPLDFPRDPKDVPFLVAAIAGEADYLITGDKDLSDAQKLVSTKIVTLSEFARLFGIS